MTGDVAPLFTSTTSFDLGPTDIDASLQVVEAALPYQWTGETISLGARADPRGCARDRRARLPKGCGDRRSHQRGFPSAGVARAAHPGKAAPLHGRVRRAHLWEALACVRE